MEDFKCYLCGCTEYTERAKKTRDNPLVRPLECRNCGLVMLSSFAHINSDYYTDSHMHDTKKWDIQIEMAQGEADDSRRYEFMKDLARNKNILDIGCGAGGFLLKVKKIAKAVAGVEPEARLQSHFQQQGLSVRFDINEIPPDFPDIITMFHVLEHLPDPINFLKTLREKFFSIIPRGVVIEVPSASDALITLYDNAKFKDFTYWSCHLFLFTEETLKSVAEKAGFQVVEMVQVQRYPLSNHLYWLAKGEPGGQHIWNFFNKFNASMAYEEILKEQKICDTILAVLK